MYKKQEEEDRTSAQTDGNQWQLRHTPIWSNFDHKVYAKGALASRMHGVHMHKVALKKTTWFHSHQPYELQRHAEALITYLRPT